MNLYMCKFCGKICADGEEDPGDYEVIDEHIVMEHREKLLVFFKIYTLKGKSACG